MKLISKIADIDGEIQELVHESKLPALNKLLDKSNDLYIERIAELEKEHERVKKYNSSLLSKLKYYISEEEAEIRDLDQQSKGIEFAIDAGIDFQQIENDVAVCNAIRTRAKAKALKEQGND